MPRRWLVGLLVLSCWAGAMGWRVKRDCLPRWKEETGTSYRSVLYGRLPWGERYRLSASGRSVGILDSRAAWEADGTVSLKHRLDLKGGLPGLGLLHLDAPVGVVLRLSLSKDYLLESFTLDGTVGDLPLSGSGTMGPQGMACRLRLGSPGKGNETAIVLPLDRTSPLLLGASPLGVLPDVPVGGEWNLGALRARLAARETVAVDGHPRAARRIEVHSPSNPMLGSMTLWVDSHGLLLKQRILGLEVERMGND